MERVSIYRDKLQQQDALATVTHTRDGQPPRYTRPGALVRKVIVLNSETEGQVVVNVMTLGTRPHWFGVHLLADTVIVLSFLLASVTKDKEL